MERLDILLAGMVAGDPHQGGATWAVLQYLLGLRALGHRVTLAEPVDRIDRRSRHYFEQVVREFDIADSVAMVVRGGRETVGLPYKQLERAAAGADVLINISGMLRDEALAAPPPVRLYLDLDPAFNQLWQAAEGVDMGLDLHTCFATVGLALGEPDCIVPTCGKTWLKTLPPVFLPLWPRATDPPATAPFTTVGNWRSYGSIEWNGMHLGQKAHSVRELIDLPGRTAERIAVALAIDPGETADLDALDRHGWERVDPREVAGTPEDYAAFVRDSKGELGIAKSGYVASRSGWFSDRSACYLASGRPVVAQDTGFGSYLPTGPGLRAFTSTGEAAEAIEAVARDYRRESDAARRLAEEELDATVVLRRLLERVS